MAICHNPRYKLGRRCLDAYQALVPPSQPTADFDGRNAVYAMKYYVLLSVTYSDKKSFRQILVNELEALLGMMGVKALGCLRRLGQAFLCRPSGRVYIVVSRIHFQ
jgi:hypothetical protein